MSVKTYNPLKWYWKVGGSTTQVFYSGDFTFKAVSDTAYVAWAVSNIASRVGSASELAQVIFTQIEPYLLALGIAVSSAGTPAINATYSLAPAAIQRLNLIASLIANGKGLPGGGGTMLYPDTSGNTHTFTSTNILNLATALQTYIYNWEAAITTKVGGGSASFPTTPVALAA